MRLAIVGSRDLTDIVLDPFITPEVTEIVSGGAAGVDSCAAEYAGQNGLKLTVLLPDYRRYGRGAPIVRNKEIVDYADKIIIFWNGTSRGTLSVINYAKKSEKPFEIIVLTNQKRTE